MIEIETLIEILEKSVEKNGEIKLTNKHLLNIIKMWDRELDTGYNADYGDLEF